ncbi:MAG: hypothetical protein QOG15_2825 [Solirubrobacteraceae bacterium]|jgi:hypothetical protein|nr:hypothetical protein [Solirubrobacteraceae bacterium]
MSRMSREELERVLLDAVRELLTPGVTILARKRRHSGYA